MKILFQTFCLLFYLNVYAIDDQKVKAYPQNKEKVDTLSINKLNQLGYDIRLTDPQQTLKYADKALKQAKEINYVKGIAEALRIKGIGKYSINQNESAIGHYLDALSYFKQINDQVGEAKVYNNIGILYRDADYDKSFEYFNQSLELAKKLHINDLTAGLYLNIGTLYQKKKNYNQALSYFQKSITIFNQLKIPAGIVACLQNTGVTYFRLNELDKAESFLLEAIQKAKKNNLNIVIASTNLTLTSLYIAEEDFKHAELALKEGTLYAELVEDTKLQYDFLYTSYELAYKRKNYQQALHYLRKVYMQDSSVYKNNVSDKISMLQEQYRQREKQRETELSLLAKKNDRIIMVASVIVAVLMMILITLLIINNKKTRKSNANLKLLNAEVLTQKENLDRINHHLEEIIDIRTRDLRIKNKKLSEYSLHLSHQIRGPIATVKGLIILDTDKLMDHEECIRMIEKCVNEIDEKIIAINQTLHDRNKADFATDA